MKPPGPRSPLAVRSCTVSGLAAGLRALGAARDASDLGVHTFDDGSARFASPAHAAAARARDAVRHRDRLCIAGAVPSVAAAADAVLPGRLRVGALDSLRRAAERTRVHPVRIL